MTVLNINGQRVTVSDDFLNLSPEDQERTVEEIAATLPQQRQENRASGAVRPFALFNEGVARIGDAIAGPVGWAVNQGLEAVGVPEQYRLSERPGHDLFAATGVQTARPENWLESGVVGAGEAAGFMLPTAGVARALSAGQGVTSGVARTVMDPFVRTPATAMAAEMGAGAGARIAGDQAERRAPDSPLVQMGAEIVGGLAGGGLPYALRSGPTAMGLRAAGRYVSSEVAPFTQQGARVIAGERLRQLVADPDRAMSRLQEPTLSDLTPAQRTGEPGLMALERTVAERDPLLREQLDERAAGSDAALRAEIDRLGGDPEAARAFFEQQIETARQAAISEAERLSPLQRPGEIGAAVRAELDRAYEIARERESEIWGRIPREVVVPATQTQETLRGLIERTGRARQADIPPVARAFFEDSTGTAEPWYELHDLYGALRQYAREEAGKPQPNNIRISNANALAEAILRDIDAGAHESTEIGQITREAIRFSRQMHEAFTQGVVGRIRGQTRAGGDRVDPQLALDASIGSGGTRGAVGAREVQAAAEFNNDYRASDSVRDSISDYMLGRFSDAAVRDGRIRLGSADAFVRNNAELLDRYPSVREHAGSAIEAERSAQAVESSLGAVYATTVPGREFARTVFGPNQTNPAAAAAQLRRQTNGDQEALAGLKGAAVDFLIGLGGRNGALSGRAISTAIQEHERALLQVLNSAELNRLRRVALELNRLEQSQRAGSLQSIVDRQPNRIVSYVLRVLAARQGAQAGQGTSGASLQTAGMASQRMQEILQGLTEGPAAALLRDAITDPELMRDLFETFSTNRATQRRVEGTLANWLQGYAATQVTSEQ